MKKVYRITVEGKFLPMFLRELDLWGVKNKDYQLKGNCIITSDPNVVDVATETFSDHPEVINIREE